MGILSDIHDGKQFDFMLHDDFLFKGNRYVFQIVAFAYILFEIYTMKVM